MGQRHPSKLILTLLGLLFLVTGCTFVVRIPAYSIRKSERPNLYRGVFHVHSKFSHDSKASLERIIRTAKRAGLDFVFVTDHNFFKDVRTTDHRLLLGLAAYHELKLPLDPLLLFASEISTDSGHVIALGIDEEPPDLWNADQVVNWIRENGGHPIVAHPLSPQKPWRQPFMEGIEGLELFTFSDIYYTRPIKELVLKSAFSFPHQFLRSVVAVRPELFTLWDGLLTRGHAAAFGAVDAHLRWEWFGFAPENFLLYFQSVTTYVHADERSEEKILDGLIRGASFIAFELYGDAQAFTFLAKSGDKVYRSGAVLDSNEEIEWLIESPKNAHIQFLRNGKVLKETDGTTLTLTTQLSGTYRVQVYRDQKLWIVANPIYVESLVEQGA